MSRNADLILVQDTVSTGLPATMASFLSGKKFVVRVPGDYAWEQGVQRFGVKENIDDFQTRSYGFAVAILRAIQKFVVRKAVRVIVPSKYLARIVKGWVPVKEIDVIYNGVRLKAGTHSQTRESNLIITSGRLVPWKGFSELIKVVAQNPEWRMVILGDGPQRNELENQIGQGGSAGHIALMGQVSHYEALSWYARATVFVLNSRYEGLSHALIEAMSAGLPVIATSVGGNTEVIQNGVNGILITSGDSVGLKRALTQVLSDDVFRKKLGITAQERAKEFSIDKTIESTASLFQSCVS